MSRTFLVVLGCLELLTPMASAVSCKASLASEKVVPWSAESYCNENLDMFLTGGIVVCDLNTMNTASSAS